MQSGAVRSCPSRPNSAAVTTGNRPSPAAAPSSAPTPGARNMACTALHPDMMRRELEREQRAQARAQLMDVERRGTWWAPDANTPANVQLASSVPEFAAVVAASNLTGRLVVVNFFRPDCAGCKVMHPKLQQIASQHTDASFLKVNASEEHILAHCQEMGLSTLPYFQLYLSGQLVSEFSCNLNTIARLRTQIALHKPTDPSRISFGDFGQDR